MQIIFINNNNINVYIILLQINKIQRAGEKKNIVHIMNKIH